MKFIIVLALLFCFSGGVSGQTVTEKDLLGCWEISEMRTEDGKTLSINDLNGPGTFIACFLENGKTVSKVIDGGKTSELGTGTFSILEDGKTIRQKRDIADQTGLEEDIDMEIQSIDAGSIHFKGGGIIMVMKRME